MTLFDNTAQQKLAAFLHVAAADRTANIQFSNLNIQT